MVNKKLNKKIVFWAISVLVFILIVYLLNIRKCDNCRYRYSLNNYVGSCPEMCFSTPVWKLLLFDITGKNLDFKSGSQIMPKPI